MKRIAEEKRRDKLADAAYKYGYKFFLPFFTFPL